MSFAASVWQIIWAETDGRFDATLATCPLGAVLAAVGRDRVPELPPQAARSAAHATDAMATVRSCTIASYRATFTPVGRGTAAHGAAAVACAACAGPLFSHSPRA